MMPEGELCLYYSGRNTLQGEMLVTFLLLTFSWTFCSSESEKVPPANCELWRRQLTYCRSDVSVCFSKFLSDSFGQSGHSVFSGTVEMLVSTRHNSMPSHTAVGEDSKKEEEVARKQL